MEKEESDKRDSVVEKSMEVEAERHVGGNAEAPRTSTPDGYRHSANSTMYNKYWLLKNGYKHPTHIYNTMQLCNGQHQPNASSYDRYLIRTYSSSRTTIGGGGRCGSWILQARGGTGRPSQ